MQSLMDGFRLDYDKLLELFLHSACAPEGDGQPTDDGLTSLPGQSTQNQQIASLPLNEHISFTTFVGCFKSLQFSAILCGHRNNNSLREFFELVTTFLLERIADTHETEVRICSFYLLYSLWFVQSKSCSLGFQIRITRELLTHVQSLVNYALTNQHLDIVIAYRRLIRADAFAFIECLDHLGPYYKTHLSRRTLTMPDSSLETGDCLEEIKLDKEEYLNTLEELNLSGNFSNCDKLSSYLNNLESN